jgi:SAM-dependent methyltransferase
MRLTTLRRHWNEFGRTDPFWAILTAPEKRGNRWSIDEFLQTGRDEIAALMAYLDARGVVVARGRALDFGCGAGRLTHALAAFFREVIGIDIAASMIDVAKQLHANVDGVRFFVNTSDTLECVASGSIDLVYSRLVLQHVHPRYVRRYLEEFVRVLRHNGVLVFQLPDEIPPVESHGVKRFLPRWVVTQIRWLRSVAAFPRMELYGLPQATVERLLTDLGTRVIDVTDDKVAHGTGTAGFLYCAVKTAR